MAYLSRMQRRALGPLEVSAVALGAGHLGGDASDREVFDLLDRALELGIDLIDTARSYGSSEARIGRWLEGRRDRVSISTKVGYGVEGHADWTPGCITAGIDRALRTLRTDRIEVVHLHSCPIETLSRGGILEALSEAVRLGKVRVAAYSGDGAALAHALETGVFGALQATVNVLDRANLPVLAKARARGLGTLAKRPLANAPWRFRACPEAHDLAIYFDRWRALALEIATDPNELCVRYAAHHPAIASVLVGTRRPSHLQQAIEAVARGPLPCEIVDRLESAYSPHRDWGAVT